MRLTAAVDHALKFNDGVVVTTGTDTMEEFAYWLDLTVRSDKPVVLTGSMRPWTVIGSDAPANLYNAIHLAASGRTTCFGAVVMLNDQIHAAREVRKSDTLRLNAFSSGSSGELGVIDQNHIRVNRAAKPGSSSAASPPGRPRSTSTRSPGGHCPRSTSPTATRAPDPRPSRRSPMPGRPGSSPRAPGRAASPRP